MKKTLKMTAAALVTGTALLVALPAQAFWGPFDWFDDDWYGPGYGYGPYGYGGPWGGYPGYYGYPGYGYGYPGYGYGYGYGNPAYGGYGYNPYYGPYGYGYDPYYSGQVYVPPGYELVTSRELADLRSGGSSTVSDPTSVSPRVDQSAVLEQQRRSQERAWSQRSEPTVRRSTVGHRTTRTSGSSKSSGTVSSSGSSKPASEEKSSGSSAAKRKRKRR